MSPLVIGFFGTPNRLAASQVATIRFWLRYWNGERVETPAPPPDFHHKPNSHIDHVVHSSSYGADEDFDKLAASLSIPRKARRYFRSVQNYCDMSTELQAPMAPIVDQIGSIIAESDIVIFAPSNSGPEADALYQQASRKWCRTRNDQAIIIYPGEVQVCSSSPYEYGPIVAEKARK